MGWLRRFQAFLHPKEVMESEAKEVVNFLTYLAEEKKSQQPDKISALMLCCFSSAM
jgi:hypothetical protein